MATATLPLRPRGRSVQSRDWGVGAVALILEVTVQGVHRFNIDQRVEIADLNEVKRNLDTLVATNHHFSIYLFPFTDECQVSTWNHTDQTSQSECRLTRVLQHFSLDR
jgi:hypothetical protein